ncbi:MAG: hypothetical protein J7K45_01825 [Thaumarchaeota archaeon]|nr:hypothetical protein [Nitrososphaerota archaeon]
MVFEIVCPKCGEVVYSGSELKPLGKVLKEYDYSCPKCGVKLSSEDFEIEIVEG